MTTLVEAALQAEIDLLKERDITAHTILDLMSVPKDFPGVTKPRTLTVAARLYILNSLIPDLVVQIESAIAKAVK